ncbi:polysaccharide deacetylase family protein [Alteribacter natronophilus]|uniref:polysaccharide deacetylase family protein n=1 Tax=Alteribacter natronophilus TaxID=2583810 RepID=UPI00110D99FD|nr:polysaccharide deacetylase family protein [Alteribacter natronophilus]TMW73034.1 polysaccharide deacetylase family protein [Alteribacter natronophilus]
MKKVIGGIAISTLLVTACTANDGEDPAADRLENEESVDTDETEDSENGEEDQEVDAEDPEGEEQGSAAGTGDEDDENAEDETDEPEVTHYLASDHTVRPLDEENDEQVVLLTIDDVPDEHGVEMAETLAELEAGAIFFVNGHFLNSEEGREQLQAIHNLGFEIGNHTMNHPNMSNLSEEEQYAEIVELNDLIEEITGERPRFYRAPFGVNTDYSKELIEEKGMQWMNWTYGYDFDADYMEAEPLAEIMVETELLRNGANLLMHDRSFTSEALEQIVTGLRENGYEPLDPERIE